MRLSSFRPNLVLVLACLLAIVLFLLGVAGPGSHIWARFLLPIAIVFLWGSRSTWRRDIYLVTALSSVFVVVTYWTDGATTPEDLLVNHLLPLAILWAAAWLLVRQRHLQEQLLAREQALDAQIKVRSAALGAREEELAKIFRANPGGIAITRQSDGVCLDANDAYLAMVGYTRGELVGRSLVELGIMGAATRDQVRALLRTQGTIHGLELQIFNARGEPVDILYSLEQIDFNGEPSYLGLIVDISASKRLAARAQQLAAIVEASHEAIISADLDGTVVSMNRSAEDLYGVSAADAVGRSIAAVALPQNLTGFADLLGRVGAGEVVTEADVSWELPHGTTRFLSVSVSPIRNEAGRVTAFTALARDVTERKRLEDALRLSEQKWRSVFEFLPVGVSVVNSKDQVTDTNAALARILAMTPEGILQGAYAHRRYFHPDLTPMPPQEFPSLRALVEKQVVRDVVIGVEKEDGELIWVSVSATPESLDGYAVTVTADITVRKRLEDALAAGEARLRAVIENTADRVWSVDVGYRLLVGNSVFAQGVQQQIGRPLALGECVVADPFPPSACAFWQPLYDRALAGESFMVEIPSGLRPGSTLACYMNPIYAADGMVAGVSGRTTDITELKRYQQLLQAANAELEARVAARTADLQAALAELKRAGKLKDEFMAMISHELRTPLTGVLSMSEILEDQVAGPLNARQSFYVKSIVASGERLLHIVNEILSYTHLLSGKVELDAAPCELATLLDICAVSQQHKAAAKNQAIAVHVTPPDLTIAADATALAEVLKRLLDNAIKFTPEGGRIGLEAHCRTAPGTVPDILSDTLPNALPDTVALVVWDTGIGIPPDQFDHVFHAFTQADGRLSRSHEGIGLGLAYVDQMVRLMGGTLHLESEPDQGSRFTITLPA